MTWKLTYSFSYDWSQLRYAVHDRDREGSLRRIIDRVHHRLWLQHWHSPSVKTDTICVARPREFIVACDLKTDVVLQLWLTPIAVHDPDPLDRLSLPPWKLTVTLCPGHKVPWSYKLRTGLTACFSSKQRERAISDEKTVNFVSSLICLFWRCATINWESTKPRIRSTIFVHFLC